MFCSKMSSGHVSWAVRLVPSKYGFRSEVETSGGDLSARSKDPN